MNITIRTASPADALKLLEIYAYYITHTAITFEFGVPTVEEFAARIENTLKNYPYLVAEADADGEIAGYIYAGRFRARAAYDWSASTSVYISRKYHRMGIGRLLYGKLEEILRRQNITNVWRTQWRRMSTSTETVSVFTRPWATKPWHVFRAAAASSGAGTI